MPTIIIPIVTHAPQSMGPALFQLVGTVAALVWGCWLMNRPLPSERERMEADAVRDELELQERNRAANRESYDRDQAKRNTPRKPRDNDTVFLIGMACIALATIIGATIYIWS